MRIRGFSLKTKMATVVSVLFLFIFAGGAIMFENTFEEHYKKIIAEQQFELVSKVAKDIDTQIREAQKILIAVSKIIPLNELNNYPAMQKHLEKVVESKFFLKTYFDDGILLYSKAGRVIGEVPYSPERYGKNFSHREFLQYTMKTRLPYISKPYRSAKPPYDPVVMFTAPIFNKKHEVVAVLGGAVSLSKDTTLGGIATVRIGKTGYMYLYNTDRTIIVHPDKKMILQKDVPPGVNRLFDKAINEWFEGSGETTTSKGLHVIGTFKRFWNTDWILAANYPIKEAYAPFLRERWYMAGYTALGIFLSILIILIVMRRNLSPLSALASQAEAIGRAEERLQSVSVETGGEIGALAFSFNEMLERLRDREASLKTTLEDLREREARISSIVNTTVDGIITIDENRIIENFNQAAEKMFGYNADEVTGRSISVLMPELHESRHDRHVQAYLNGGRHKGLGAAQEVLGRRKDGSTFPIELSVSEADLGDRRIFTGILRDITERKKGEEELQKAKEAAESANQAKSDFLASMSHEIRTPMNAIIGMAELMMETPLNDEQKRYIEILIHAGDNLLNIINDILDISKIEAGYLELESTGFNLQELLDKAYAIMAIRANDKGIILDCRVLPDVPVNLIGDPSRLRQVILNLLGNAIKFTEEGEVVLVADKYIAGIPDNDIPQPPIQYPQPEEVTLRFSVRDTGIGISEDKVNGIFEKFTQADSSTTRRYGGTGLGLAISKRLVELMGGRIWVTSIVGAGSTFYFTAPFRIQKEKPQSEPAAAAAISGHETLRPLHILLVDDSGDNRLLVQSLLKKTPFTIDTADNGKAAVEKYKSTSYDLILMDIQMPVMDGYTATKEIRAWEQLNNRVPTPVIALTAYALQEEIRKSYDAGCSGHLTKPIKKNELIGAIMAHARGSGVHKQGPGDNAAVITINKDLEDLIPGYLENRRKDIASIKEALEKDDFEVIRILGHSMKGSGGGYGFNAITEIGKKIDEAAKNMDKKGITEQVEELSAYLHNIKITYE
ncbi:MAG: Autoinducer 2 sensor kinase/phosphatase LuxQ [Syntrophorhabdus sp. PtaU1.Bin058]|nr:MAG: Autoinducer 2 sensor kinase/phosphatase LuxQ [Syntrophorhabdus sp. PtaU1.Bin058]